MIRELTEQEKKQRDRRNRLKVSIYADRSVWIAGKGTGPICPICGKIIRGVGNMHEALLSKMLAPGENQHRINDRRNCVILHPTCHVPGIGGNDILKKCFDYLCEWEGKDYVMAWLESMRIYWPTATGQVIQRIKNLEQEI